MIEHRQEERMGSLQKEGSRENVKFVSPSEY
jgi:hypothetical protein